MPNFRSISTAGLKIVEDPEGVFAQFPHHRLERVPPKVDLPFVTVNDTGIDKVSDMVVDA